MRTRHRAPTIFNLSMVDVLCCALGCVILLWLLNLRSAKDEAVRAGQAGELLKQSSAEAEALRGRLRGSEQQAGDLAAKLQAMRADRDQAAQTAEATAQDLAAARARLAELDKEMATLKAQGVADAARLSRLTKDRVDAARRADDLASRLLDAEARVRDLRGLADMVPDLRGKLADATARLRALEEEAGEQKKDATDASRRLAALEEEKKLLAHEITRARAAADNRFAGITLTGRRVVFLVDMSGSMELVDEKTPAPDKWAGVRDTLAKLMRSLPELEKFQVILFSTQVTYLLGNDNRWLDFDKTSVERVQQALAVVKPRGDTNMFAALQATFRYRSAGLDTVYLLSDGLPNMGEGVSMEAAKRLSETERADLLGKHVLRTLRGDWNRDLSGRPRVRINAVGFFYESPDVGAFLWALARENDGSFVGMSKP